MAMPIATSPRNNPSHAMLHQFHTNVRAYGATGDGATDDTTAIQTAINVARDEGGTGCVYFPRGNYKITSTIDLSDPHPTSGSTKTGCMITGSLGPDADPSPGTWVRSGVRIFGNFNGFLFQRTTASSGTGYYPFHQIGLQNLHATGKCIELNSIQAPTSIMHCNIRGHTGVVTQNNTFNFQVSNCSFVGNGGATSVGLSTVGHTSAYDLDITSYNKGVQAANGLNLIGARIENCGYATYLGSEYSGAITGWAGIVGGLSTEACDYGIYVRKGFGVVMNCGVNGTPSSPSGGGIKGFTTEERQEGLTFIANRTVGAWTTDYDIQNNATVESTIFLNCTAISNTWTIGNYSNLQLINCEGTSDVIRVPVIATASLPAAGTQQNGRLIVEDNGAGDRNLILYGGGQRFRIDGGAAI